MGGPVFDFKNNSFAKELEDALNVSPELGLHSGHSSVRALQCYCACSVVTEAATLGC